MKTISALVLFLFMPVLAKTQLSFTMAAGCSGTTQTQTANTGTGIASSYTWAIIPAGPILGTPNASATTLTLREQVLIQLLFQRCYQTV